MLRVWLAGLLLPAVWAGDEVSGMPGWEGEVPFHQHAGYLSVGEDRQLFYWLVSSSTSSTRPLILWLAGGPGCSSLAGTLIEMGPWRVNDDAKSLRLNSDSWIEFADMLFLDAPAGVGFSTTTGNVTYTDDMVAADNHAALRAFFDRHSWMRGRAFYLAGESYAGTYVPTLAARLLDDKDMPFEGMIIGDGCLNAKLEFNSLIQYNWAHGFVDARFYADAMHTCCNDTECDWHSLAEKGGACADKASTLYHANEATGLETYFLDFECKRAQTARRLLSRRLPPPAKLDSPLFTCPHYDDFVKYLRLPSVRAALHVYEKAPEYEACSDAIGAQYVMQYTDMTTFFQGLIAAEKKILLFNGDVDSVCNHIHNSAFLEQLGAQQTVPLTPWTMHGRVPPTIGFVTEYSGASLVVVRGAGHFASEDDERPKETRQAVGNFVLGRNLSDPLPYNKWDSSTTTASPITTSEARGFASLIDVIAVLCVALFGN